MKNIRLREDAQKIIDEVGVDSVRLEGGEVLIILKDKRQLSVEVFCGRDGDRDTDYSISE